VTAGPDENQTALEIAEAANRAGQLVTEQIQSIIDQAQASATELRHNAEEEANRIRAQAADSANRILERIRALDGPLSELVAELQREAERLGSDNQHAAS
jgi:cell division septum initiation protein DivIVA